MERKKLCISVNLDATAAKLLIVFYGIFLPTGATSVGFFYLSKTIKNTVSFVIFISTYFF